MGDICKKNSYLQRGGSGGGAGGIRRETEIWDQHYKLLWLPTRQSFCLKNKQND